MRGLRAVMKLKPDKVLRDKFFTPESYQHPVRGDLAKRTLEPELLAHPPEEEQPRGVGRAAAV